MKPGTRLGQQIILEDEMNDKTLQISLTALSIVCLLWIILGSIFYIFPVVWCIIIGLVVWVVGGGALLKVWGKNYMSRLV